jgi:poly-gamma-glutamate capsule biosynthesis protein CapA/YwtB (metallophosphatase superfamily)
VGSSGPIHLLLAVVAVLAVSACTAEPTTQARPSPEPSARSQSPTTLPPEPAAPERKPLTTLTVVGDIMLGRGVAGQPGGPPARLRPMAGHLRAADLTVGNLESTLSDDGPAQQGTDSFHAPPSVLGALAEAGVDALSLANNHTGDYGERALLQTLRRVDRSPVERVGAGLTRDGAWRPVVVERQGVRFGFVAFNAIGETPRATATSPGAAEIRMQPRTGPLHRPDLRKARREIRALRRADVDAVIVLPHWGAQYTHTPVPAQRRVGRALVNAGADIVVGGHPHWVQRVQRHRGTLIVHSLGNFVFDMDFMQQTQEGVVADLRFVGDELRSVRFTPYVIGSDFAPRVVRGARARAILRPLGVPRTVRLSG